MRATSARLHARNPRSLSGSRWPVIGCQLRTRQLCSSSRSSEQPCRITSTARLPVRLLLAVTCAGLQLISTLDAHALDLLAKR